MSSWIVFIVFLSGDMMTIPLTGQGTKLQCQKYALELLKEDLPKIKGIKCLPKQGQI